MANEQLVEVPSTDYYFQHFRDAFSHTYMKFVESQGKEAIMNVLGTNVISTSLYVAFTPSPLESLVDLVFRNNYVRDFILTLSGIFYMRIDRGGLEWNTLVERLALSYAVTTVHTTNAEEFDNKYRLIPNVYSERLPEFKDIQGYLQGNRWLVVLCMIDQCITMGDLLLMASAKPPKK